MPTPPITIPVASPIGPISTPEIKLPCNIVIPSIPLIPDFSFTIKIPSFNIFPTKKPKKGAKPTRKKAKGETIVQKIARYKKMCSTYGQKRPKKTEAPPPPKRVP